jgi:uncharacterized membrane protein YeaQ/YmgE (transglycosylase-associated protein family)
MGTIGSVISWIFFGFVVGLIARALYPGRQKLGCLTTVGLGIAGSLVGGFISYLLGYDPEAGAFRGAGWIMSILGAVIVVAVWLYSKRDRVA